MPIGSGTQFAELPPEVERDLGGLKGGLTFDKAAVRSRRPLLDHKRRHHRASPTRCAWRSRWMVRSRQRYGLLVVEARLGRGGFQRMSLPASNPMSRPLVGAQEQGKQRPPRSALPGNHAPSAR
jgi:hypothetical protein